MRISDWSSDVCSSDLLGLQSRLAGLPCATRRPHRRARHFSAPWPLPAYDRVPAALPAFIIPRSQQAVDHTARTGRLAVFARDLEISGRSGDSWQSRRPRSEEPTSELQSLMRTSYAVFCLNKKKQKD